VFPRWRGPQLKMRAALEIFTGRVNCQFVAAIIGAAAEISLVIHVIGSNCEENIFPGLAGR